MNAEKKKNELYYEKFRCKKIEQLDLLPRIKDVLGNGELIQNVLLYSTSPGTGKTTLSRILGHDLPTLEINASNESSVEVIRQKITDFCSTLSVLDGAETLKKVHLDECLHENEMVRIGSIDNWKSIQLKNLQKGEIYPCISVNLKTGELENDTCEIVSDKEDELYEVELEDGKIIQVTINHPFIIMENGKLTEKSINSNLNSMDNVCVYL